MNTLIISLPDDLKDFLNAQIAKGEYKSHSDFVQQVLMQAKNEKAMEKLPNDFPFDPNLLKVFSSQGAR
jgi:Arc/MetJ-type ribon-helix-helix transcriptional regulator